jgi:hypothetical protein
MHECGTLPEVRPVPLTIYPLIPTITPLMLKECSAHSSGPVVDSGLISGADVSMHSNTSVKTDQSSCRTPHRPSVIAVCVWHKCTSMSAGYETFAASILIDPGCQLKSSCIYHLLVVADNDLAALLFQLPPKMLEQPQFLRSTLPGTNLLLALKSSFLSRF